MKRNAKKTFFTLAEMLAALALTAVVVPIAMHGIRIASRAAEMALRTERACRTADHLLQDLVASGQWSSSPTAGAVDDWPEARWELSVGDWAEDDNLATAMTELTVTVLFSISGREAKSSISTLVSANE